MSTRSGLRLTIAISALAALMAVFVLLALVMQMNRANRALERDGVLEFNFVQQADHNLDALARAATALRDADEQDRAALTERLLTRYDVLFSRFSRGTRWTDSMLQIEGASELLERIRGFTLSIEPRMTRQAGWAQDELIDMAAEAMALSSGVHRIGSNVFQRKADLRDAIEQRMNRLITLFWIFGVLFLVAGLTLYLSMARALSSSARLAREAQIAREQLQTALDEVTDSDIARKARNRFFAAATHDLRQPLQAMQYYLAALVPHVPQAPGQDILARIGRSTDSAQSMLSGLLDLSKLDANVLVPRNGDVDLDALLDFLIEEFAVEASERSLTLARNGRAGWIRTDPQLLERVLKNLIANAIAYTERGGITLRARRNEPDSVMLEVIDTGIGIPGHELALVFNEYHQADNALRDGSGLGLGLSIVRRLTRLLEIPLAVDSASGQGTRFKLTLAATQPVPAFEAQPQVDETRPMSLDRLVVLVIDDDDAVREGVSTLLRQRGCRIECASDVDDALVCLVGPQLVPDLLLADYRLPNGRTGLEAIDVIREELNEDVPAMVVTGDTTPALQGEAASAGVMLLHKPIDAQELFRCIGLLVRREVSTARQASA